MDCLVLPVSILLKRSRFEYRPLIGDEYGDVEGLVTVVVGKEKRKFLVEPFVLEENQFRVLMNALNEEKKGKRKKRGKKVIYLDHIDAILFEHLLWLMHNDCSSFFSLNLLEILDFYAQDN